ncbi:MAG: flagellar basal-body MS-ring/collar protein FliF [Candidatus Nanopelagicales bacterium]
MIETLQLSLRRMRTLMSGFTPGQLAVVAFGAIGVLIAVLMMSRWSAAPYTPLYSNLAASDASAITQQLDSLAVPYQLAEGGTQILVPPDQVNSTRLSLSAKGLPAASQSGFALLDQQGITSSEFMQNVNYQRAMEGELANTIEAIDGISSATVHLAVPDKSVFTQQSDKPSAAVLVTMRSGATLDPGQVQAIASLVASSIPKLSASDVTVADSSGQLLTTGAGAGGIAGTNATQQSARTETQLTMQAQAMLDRVLGVGNSTVQVHTDLDFDQRQTTTQSYAYPTTVPALTSSTASEQYSSSGSGATSVMGTANAAPSAPPGASTVGSPGSNTYQKSSETTTNALNSVVEQRTGAPGSIKRMTVAVLVNSAIAGVKPTELSALVGNAVGLDTNRGDTIQIAQVPFNTTAKTDLAQQAQAAQEAASKADLWDMVRKIGIALLVFTVIAMAFLSSRKQRRTLLELNDIGALEAGPHIRPASPYETREFLDPIDLSTVVIPPIGQVTNPDHARIEQAHAEIGELVARQPEEVVQLLRGWMSDRR